MTTFEQRNLWVNLTPISREEFMAKIAEFKARASHYQTIKNMSFILCLLNLFNMVFSLIFGVWCFGTADGTYLCISAGVSLILFFVFLTVGKNSNIKHKKFEKVLNDNPIPNDLVSNTNPESYLNS